MTSDDLTELLASIDGPASPPGDARARVWERVQGDLRPGHRQAATSPSPAGEDAVLKIEPRIESKPSVPHRRWHRITLAAAVALVITTIAIFDRQDQQLQIATDLTTERVAESLDEQGPVSALSFDLVGGEVTRNFDDLMGWAFADQPLDSMSSPGPRIEVRLGDEVTINFTNRHGWSQDPDDEFYSSVDQSFRIYETGGSVGDVLWGADTGLVAPGETASVTFTPDQVGEYRYTSVGLVMTGMWGAFVVLDNP